ISSFFTFTSTATTQIYTLSLHDALPIFENAILSPVFSSPKRRKKESRCAATPTFPGFPGRTVEGICPTAIFNVLVSAPSRTMARSEEHTSELQSQSNLVCRLLLEKKKKK